MVKKAKAVKAEKKEIFLPVDNQKILSELLGVAKKQKGAVVNLTYVCHSIAKACGWWSKKREDGTLIALMHSELSEALEGLRKNKMDEHLPHRKSVEVELADTVIRIFDFAGHYGLDIGGAIVEKLKYNTERADHKPSNRKKSNGKKF